MNNRQLSWTRKYNNNHFIIASRSYFQQSTYVVFLLGGIVAESFALPSQLREISGWKPKIEQCQVEWQRSPQLRFPPWRRHLGDLADGFQWCSRLSVELVFAADGASFFSFSVAFTVLSSSEDSCNTFFWSMNLAVHLPTLKKITCSIGPIATSAS